VKLLESLAAAEHARWAHWQEYVHQQCTPNSDGSLTIPAHLVERWNRQISLSYDELTENEKASDRIEAEITMTILREYLLFHLSSMEH
jgi:hypothetical protein